MKTEGFIFVQITPYLTVQTKKAKSFHESEKKCDRAYKREKEILWKRLSAERETCLLFD